MTGRGSQRASGGRPAKRARHGTTPQDRVLDALAYGSAPDVLTALADVAPRKDREKAFHLYRAAVLQVIGEKRLLSAEIDVLQRRWPTDLEVIGEIAEYHSDRDEPRRVLAMAAKGERVLRGRRRLSRDVEHIEKLALLKADAQAQMGHVEAARRTLVAGLTRLAESWKIAEGLSRLKRGRRVWQSLLGGARPRRRG